MGVIERKHRDRDDRRKRIIAAAREIAESEGWGAVTIRRLADEIEYSQPVLYSHFDGRDAIIAAISVDGFRELTLAIRGADNAALDRGEALGRVAMAYLAYARNYRAVYEAMFTLTVGLRFAEPDSKIELKNAFAALTAAISPSSDGSEALTETFWAGLHGLAELERSGRIGTDLRGERVGILVRGLLDA